MKNFNQSSYLKLWLTALISYFLIANQAYSQTIAGTAFFDGNNNGIKDAK